MLKDEHLTLENEKYIKYCEGIGYVKFNKEEVWQVKTEMFDLKNWLEVKTKKKDLFCPECKRSYAEIGEKIGMMTFHGKPNTAICNDCGRKYIELGAIDINENQRIRKELEDKIYALNPKEKLDGVPTSELQTIIDKHEAFNEELRIKEKEIADNQPSEEDWEIEDYLIKQYNVYQDKRYLTHESQIEEVFKDIGYDYLDCGQGYYQDEEEVIVKIGNKFYNVHFYAEIGSAKQAIGDRLYWVERIKSVEWEKIDKPIEKKELYYNYKIKLNKDTKRYFESLLKENDFEFEVE